MGNCQNNRSLSSMTRKKKYLIEDEEEIQNDVMQFLIVLCDSDFKSPCLLQKKYSTRVKNSGGYLSGILDVINVRDVSKRRENNRGKNVLQYKINEVVNLKTLYIKLPKEKLYVKSNRWQFEYMKSQVREILHMFGLLGAKNVEYEIINSNANLVNFLTQVTTGKIPIESGFEINSKNILSTEISGRTEYAVPKTYPTEKSIYNSNNIYYLSRKDDWQDICERRIVYKVTVDNFTYKFNTDVSFSAKVTEKFRGLGISFNISSEETKNFTMNFKVNYYTEDEIYLLNKEMNEKRRVNINEETDYQSDDDRCFRSHFETDYDEDLKEIHYHSDNEDKENFHHIKRHNSSFIRKKLKKSSNDSQSNSSNTNSPSTINSKTSVEKEIINFDNLELISDDKNMKSVLNEEIINT